MRDEITQRVMGWFSVGGVSLFTGVTVAEVEVWIRISVGVLTVISLAVHTYIAISKYRKKDD